MFKKLMMLFYGWVLLVAILFGLYAASIVYVCGWDELPGRFSEDYRPGYYPCIWMNNNPNYKG